VNPDGGTGIRVNGLTYSGVPTWVTTSPLDDQAVDVAFNVAFDATGATSYSNTTALPAGTQLLSNGYFYGTVTGIVEETTYNFTVRATDAENQDADKAFSVTVTVAPSIQIYSWGYNNVGQLGLNSDLLNKSSPVQIGASTDWSEVLASRSASFALKSDGTLWAWGFNSSGQLAQNDNINRSSPTQIGSLTDWSKVYSRSYSVFAIKTNGTLWVWGTGDGGALGLNTQGVNKSSPVQLGSGTNWAMVAPSRSNCILATKTDGTMWAWGTNTDGRLGLNDQVERSSPVQVGSSTDWSYITFGQRNAYAIKTTGTLWTTGQANFGALGLNNTATNVSNFTQVGTQTNWSLVSSSAYGVMAIKTDNTLWGWGYNNVGQIGRNDVINRSSPIQVGSAEWQLIGTMYYACLATKTDGSLWSWGNNGFGKLGLNVAGNKSSPTQIGTDLGWALKSFSDYHVAAYKTI
jgi:alpha-tubulin suppressor-like RCC1 family protein